ncbi:VOC family protein [Nonomuraea sp. NPDC050556]|uniref:VOC family protein n=1 Tax=Nonomuraea sp. NPDC050556 TaxID=3364369 RepID=UPI0037AC4168
MNGLHHVGHLVHDMGEAIKLYRELGFTVSPPAYPVIPGVEPFGVANAHIYLDGGFIELVALVDERLPSDARPIPLHVPEERRAGLVEAVRATAAQVAGRLELFEGLHILMFDTSDLDATAARLDGHGGVHAVQREGELVRYFEFLGLPEGRVGFAETPSVVRVADHANSARRLVSCELRVPDVGGFAERYALYDGPVRVVGGAEEPAFSSYTVEVRSGPERRADVLGASIVFQP